MPIGSIVRPQKWKNVIDIYDDGTYSAVWGNYDNSKNRCLGVRWNGGTGVGFPNQGNNPLWFVEHDCLSKMILLDFLDKVNKDNAKGSIENILLALQECS